MKINLLFVVGAGGSTAAHGSNLVGYRLPRDQSRMYLALGASVASSLSMVGGDDRQRQRQHHVLGSMDSNRHAMNVVEGGLVSVHLEFSFMFISCFTCNGTSSRLYNLTGPYLQARHHDSELSEPVHEVVDLTQEPSLDPSRKLVDATEVRRAVRWSATLISI